jgi:uncharacterized membrane protein
VLRRSALLAPIRDHVRHHARFYLAALIGLLVWLAAPMLRPALRLVVAGDALFASYLASTGLMALRATPDAMRRRADYEDEGMILVIVLTLGAITVSLASIFALIVRDGGGPLLLAFTIASVSSGRAATSVLQRRRIRAGARPPGLQCAPGGAP